MDDLREPNCFTASIGTDASIISVPVKDTLSRGVNTEEDPIRDNTSEREADSYVTDLLECIRELNKQIQSKDQELEAFQEEQRCKNLWAKQEDKVPTFVVRTKQHIFLETHIRVFCSIR